MSLIEQLRAAIDETEQIARGAWQENWRWYAEDKTVMTHADQRGDWDGYRTAGTRADAEHIARHDPESVLRRCAADREILDAYEHADKVAGDGISPEGNYANGLEFAVKCIAEAYGVTDTLST